MITGLTPHFVQVANDFTSAFGGIADIAERATGRVEGANWPTPVIRPARACANGLNRYDPYRHAPMGRFGRSEIVVPLP